MKILRIGILNLNSLRGEQEIDFTTSPLADHQLYAITGPTGAGKTTILDAITLALYGQTERNKSEKDRKDGSGSVMTYGTGECRAELEYATTTGKFRNVWHRQRAHKKPDRDLTASRREISKWNPQTEVWDILATKKREVDTKTEEVVGLDYDRFVRSVMLTQGDFARFLKSDPGDKAAILEKITGTEIYKDLSIAAYTRAKLAREEWERATAALTMAPPLEAEVRTSLEDQLKDKQAESTAIAVKFSTLAGQLEVHQKLTELSQKLSAAEQQNEQLTARWAAMESDRGILDYNNRLEPYRTRLERLKQIARERQTLTQRQEEVGASVAKLTAAQAILTAAVTVAREKRQAFDAKLPEREAKFTAAAKLETALAELSRDRLAAQEATNKARTAAVQVTEQVEACAQTIREITQQLGGKDSAAIEADLQQTEGLVHQREQALRLVEQQVTAARLREQLGKERTLAIALVKELQTAQQAEVKVVNATATAQKTLDEAIIRYNGLRVSASLHEHKANLQPGEECPVCGATEHPALATYKPVEASRVQAAAAEVERLRAELTKVTTLREQARPQVQALERRSAEVNARIVALQEQLVNTQVTLAEQTTLVGILQFREELQQQLQANRLAYQQLQGLRKELPRLNAANTRREGLLERQTELGKELQQAEAKLAALTKEITAKQAEKEALIPRFSVAEARRKTQDRDDKLRKDLAAVEADERQQAAELAAVTERAEVLRESLERLTAERTELMAALEEKISVGRPTADNPQPIPPKGQRPLALTIDQAQALLLPVTDFKILRNRVNQFEQLRATAAAMGKQLVEQVTAAQAKVKDLPDHEALKATKEELDHQARTVNQLIGALNLQLKQDDERLAEVAAKKQAIAGLRKDADRWQRMSDLIGSADGKKFRSYAQAITLQQLIAIGNDHLSKINPRYRMEYEAPTPGAPERLEMIIIDQYQNDNRRTMATLSGGESFLISLALALGLSDLASGKRLIQSLFIDEGFGTLDGKTLDQAMTTLEQLQAQGKTIGLISHVPQLQERIQCQLQLKRVGDGFSRVEVEG